MHNFLKIPSLVVVTALAVGCSRVGPGEVGVRYHTAGGDRGVETIPVGVGYYVTGFFTHIETFPTFQQNYTWEDDESMNFSDINGLNINAAIGISYHIDPAKVPALFVKYRLGINEITNVYIHNMVRDSLVDVASQKPIEYIYGPGRATIIAEVQNEVQRQVLQYGIIIDKIYWIGKLGLPQSVQAAIDSKNAASQQAQQRENEVATAQAQAQIEVAKAQGDAKALLTRAQSQAEANKLLEESLTPNYIEYLKAQKWNGILPQVTSGNSSGMFLNVNTQPQK